MNLNATDDTNWIDVLDMQRQLRALYEQKAKDEEVIRDLRATVRTLVNELAGERAGKKGEHGGNPG